MHLLLYCIFHRSSGRPTDGLRGVDLQPILEITNDGLSAAVSEVRRLPALQEVPQILIYESVISALHKKHSLIPMRFGCLLDGPSTVMGLLCERHADFLKTISEISDCEEMGIHILLEKHPGCGGPPAEPAVSRCSPASVSPADGRAYLASRRRHYDSISKEELEHQTLLERVCSDLTGLFERCRVDEHKSHIPLLPVNMRLVSFRFLVHRTLLGDFRAAAERSLSRMDERWFLGEPSPPFSFVSA